LQYFRDRSPADRPTAVMCYNDLVALGLIRALRELGIGVPEHVSVVGFDDLALMPYVGIPLTTVHVPKVQMGERATELLIRHIEAPKAMPPERIYYDGKLVVRSSTRSLRD
jgi:LacI family transcriptional regulator